MSYQLPLPAAEATISPALRHVCTGLVLLAVIVLWLAALSALLARDGLTMRSEGCLISAYRDPVSGRTAPVRGSYRDIASEPCRTTAMAQRR